MASSQQGKLMQESVNMRSGWMRFSRSQDTLSSRVLSFVSATRSLVSSLLLSPVSLSVDGFVACTLYSNLCYISGIL